MASLSNSGVTHPPRSKPPLRSSSGAPSPCITPSTVTMVTVVSFIVAGPFSLGLVVVRLYRTAAPSHRSQQGPSGSPRFPSPDSRDKSGQQVPATERHLPDRLYGQDTPIERHGPVTGIDLHGKHGRVVDQRSSGGGTRPGHRHETPPALEPVTDASLQSRLRYERRREAGGRVAERSPVRAVPDRLHTFHRGVALAEGAPGEGAGLQDQLRLDTERGRPPQDDVGQATGAERAHVGLDPVDTRRLGRDLG